MDIIMAHRKLYESPAACVADVPDGATVLIGGTSLSGEPTALLTALASGKARNLTCVCDFSNWNGAAGLLGLIESGRVDRLISPCPFPASDGGKISDLVQSGSLTLEMVPQGTLAERLRAGGAGIGGVFVPVGIGTRFAEGEEVRNINGVECVLESPLRADFALLRAHRADAVGNLVYRGTQRGWNPAMATAARVAIAEVDQVGEPGSIDPELVITPGIFVNRLVLAAQPEAD
jgi:3-oxoadipate CoA-transferase alpha subunit